MDQVFKIWDLALKISIVLFMVGSLLDMGLKLKVQDALGGLRNRRFVVQSVLWGFVLCPGLAYLLTRVIPLDPAYARGLVLLGMAPCAPFLPLMVERARGDMGATAAFMLLTLFITVIYMPIAVPVMVKGLTASAWTIAKPLLYFVLVPLAMGMAIQGASAPIAAKLQPVVKQATGLDTIIMLALVLVVYGKEFIGAVGTYAIGTQILFFSVATPLLMVSASGCPLGKRAYCPWVWLRAISERRLRRSLALRTPTNARLSWSLWEFRCRRSFRCWRRAGSAAAPPWVKPQPNETLISSR